MLCEKCKKREAVVRYTVVKNKTRTEHNYCMECAASLDMGNTSYAGLFDGQSQLGRLLSGILGFAMDRETEDEDVNPSGIVCPVCQTSYAEFVKDSRFGCPDCYDVFDLMMGNQIKTIQGSEEHRGKHPVHMRSVFDLTRGEGALKTEEAPVLKEKVSIEEKISVLRLRLKEAIHEEDYESAASLRDEIRALEAGVTDHE